MLAALFTPRNAIPQAGTAVQSRRCKERAQWIVKRRATHKTCYYRAELPGSPGVGTSPGANPTAKGPARHQEVEELVEEAITALTLGIYPEPDWMVDGRNPQYNVA